MADTAAADQSRGDFGRGGFGRGGFGRGGSRGARREGGAGPRGPRRGGKDGDKEWVPFTKLGRLVRDGKIRSIEEIYLHAMPIKEHQIVDRFLGSKLKDEVMKIMPVQKQTRAGQRTRFKAVVIVGDRDGHCGVGVRTAPEVAGAMKGALIQAKMNLVPVRRGYWGNKMGAPHTVPCKVHGKCGSVTVRLIPAPRGAGIVAAPVPKKLLQLAGLEDVYTGSCGHTKSTGNFLKATYFALESTYAFKTPEFWKEQALPKTLFQSHSDYLRATATHRR